MIKPEIKKQQASPKARLAILIKEYPLCLLMFLNANIK